MIIAKLGKTTVNTNPKGVILFGEIAYSVIVV